MAQSDPYYELPEYRYSDQLVTGVEFTWEISKLKMELNSDATLSDDDSLEDIRAGMSMTVKIIQDLSNFNLTDFYAALANNTNDGIDNYFSFFEIYYADYFEISYSEDDEEAMKGFLPIQILISQNTIEYPNGTVINTYELAYEQFQQREDTYFDELEEAGISSTYEIKGGIAIQKQQFDQTEDGFSGISETRFDIDSGVLIYLNSNVQDEDGDFELEFRLKNSKGIEINTIVPNDDPTLSIPFSATFVFALLLIP
ncbi:MAG: hypothetical protein GPJ54_21925, partial [Candidatus Heimdallarchaeota archaeon]|nr:hypothetical protein [Candidatus Heimdallarchaeota archaeon]